MDDVYSSRSALITAPRHQCTTYITLFTLSKFFLILSLSNSHNLRFLFLFFTVFTSSYFTSSRYNPILCGIGRLRWECEIGHESRKARVYSLKTGWRRKKKDSYIKVSLTTRNKNESIRIFLWQGKSFD